MSGTATRELPPARLDRAFQALADPGRRALMEQLARGPASVSALAAPAALRLPAVLKHLRLLEEGGLVASQKSGRVRTYRIRRDAFAAVTAWIGQRQAEMNAAFDRLEALMAAIPEEDTL